MKKIIYLLFAISIYLASCKKEKDETIHSAPVFIGITAADTTLLINDSTVLSAIATGEELTYTWSFETYATFSNQINEKITFTMCHAGSFIVYCDVENPWGKVRKSITMQVK